MRTMRLQLQLQLEIGRFSLPFPVPLYRDKLEGKKYNIELHLIYPKWTFET